MRTMTKISWAWGLIFLVSMVTAGWAGTAGYTSFTSLQADSAFKVGDSGVFTVDSSGNVTNAGTWTSTGAGELNGDLTLQNDEIVSNGTDAVVSLTFNDDAVELGDVQLRSSNTGTADNDYLLQSYWIKDDNTTPAYREQAQVRATALDVTSTSLDSSLKFYVNTAALAATGPSEILNLVGATPKLTFHSDAAELGDLQLAGSTASSADNDYAQISFWTMNDNATPSLTEFVQIIAKATDITTTSLDSLLTFAVQTAGTSAPTAELVLSGAAIYPNADAGLNLGIASTNQFGAIYTDAIYLGDAGGKKLVPYTGTIPAGSGSSAVNITAAGVDADDVCLVTPVANSDQSVINADCGSGVVAVTMSGNETATATLLLFALED